MSERDRSMGGPLDVAGELDIDADGESLRVRGEGNRLIVEASSLRGARRAFETLPINQAAGGGERGVQAVRSLLSRADVSVEFRVRGSRVATLDARGRSNLLGRVIGGRAGVGPMRASLGGVIRSVFG